MADFKLRPGHAMIGQPITIGDVVLDSAQPMNIVSVSPFKGRGMAVNEALKTTINLGLPAVGKEAHQGQIRAMWVGQGQWFIVGDVDHEAIAKALEDQAAVTDQSDAWLAFTLCGPDSTEVMARLCPLDLGKMQQNQTARTEFAQMMACITPVEGGFEVMVMRSFAKTAIRHTREAMTRLAARRAL